MAPNSPAGTWQIAVTGPPTDLEHLARHFTQPPARVLKEEQDGGSLEFIYESVSFAALASDEEVRAKADGELTILSGALRIARGSSEPIKGGNVYRIGANGGRNVFLRVHVGHAAIYEGADVVLAASNAAGEVVAQAPSPPKTLVLAQLAGRDRAVAKVMRLAVAADARTWVGLYRTFEVIKHDLGGEKEFMSQDWGSANDLKRFTHTANSVAAAGDAARHGAELTMPPKKPMTLEESNAYVAYIVQCWLSLKGV